MIARYWRGVTTAENSKPYLDYLTKTGVHEILQVEGNQGIHLLHRINGDEAEFLFISYWDSYDSIRKFAGPDEEVAVYYPEDRKYLRTLESKVTHYECEKFDVPKRASADIQSS
jgi:heme-degrading monooxygenase HmoA